MFYLKQKIENCTALNFYTNPVIIQNSPYAYAYAMSRRPNLYNSIKHCNESSEFLKTYKSVISYCVINLQKYS